MSFHLTKRVIKLLCGQTAYARGEAYYNARKVTFMSYDEETLSYEANVKGSNSYEVTIEIDDNGDVDATCTCPAFLNYDNYCKHIAAVLLNIHGIEQGERTPVHTVTSILQAESRSSVSGRGLLKPEFAASVTGHAGISAGDLQLMSSVLGLFGDKPLRPSRTRPLFDSRTPLDVEITLSSLAYGFRKQMLGIELRVGTKRLYIVQKIRELLERIKQRESFVFSKHFTYDPELYSFQKETDAVLQQLIEISHNEKLYRETASIYYSHANSISGDRVLLIPPIAWESLLPLLMQVPSLLLQLKGHTYNGIHMSDDALPLQFTFDQTGLGQMEGYQLDIHGLEQITVMEDYGIAFFEGKLLRMPHEQGKRLSELKQMLESSRKQQIRIPAEQMEPFMEKVLPGLMKLGSVHIAQVVSARMLQTPLKAKLYLDRVKDRLLAGLEFQYGDIVINPLEGDGQARGSDRILLRDGDQERLILDYMEQTAFGKTESGYFTDDEEAEYDFLYSIVPKLEKLLTVYATTAVKAKLHTGFNAPKITVDVDERTDWLAFRFDMDGIPDAEIRGLLASLEEKRKYHRMPDGSLLPLEGAEFAEIARFTNEMGIRQRDIKGAQLRLPIVRGLHLIDAEKLGSSIKLGKSFRRLLENMRNPDNLDFPVPEHLTHILRDYQVYGYQWLKTLAHYHFGGILADDMGLGKTLQSIAFLVSVLPDIRAEKLPALIVSPASLVYNWQNEFRRFAPELRTVITDGSKLERDSLLKNISKVDVIITSYPLLRRDIAWYASKAFHTLFLDEAQMFKNHTTQTAQAVKEIRAKYRFALTGTPVENRLEELWSIFDAVFPELFPGRRAFSELPRDTVARRIRPFLLRRLKTDVLKELPDKIETLQASELLPEQKKLYVAYLAKLQQETVKHLNEESFQKNRIKILAGLTRLRQLCCHPALFVEGYTGSSAKFEQLLELVEECRSAGKRMLIFSQFTEMLGIIGRELGVQGVPFFYLDGKTPAFERVELCRK
ncbi:MAG: SNF2 helicase associated domain-containing protein, partial [Gorillibacterium sp.]|nr:SNF2 helicase associated domain-containing protein [Gorillibacterium sp.]